MVRGRLRAHGTPPKGPLSPREEQATLRVLPGFRVELVASEPQVIDPVALAFDENGRLFVAEMRGYPNDGVGTGDLKSGRIRVLEDLDGDGFYEKSTLFAGRPALAADVGVMPWQAAACSSAMRSDILFFEDTKHTGKADRKRVPLHRLRPGEHPADD